MLDDLFCIISLVLKGDGLGVSFVNFAQDSIEGHNSPHEQDGNSGSKETNDNVVIHDASMDDIALKG